MEIKYSDLMSKIPSDLLNDLASEFKINKINHKLTGQSLFQILLYNICEEDRISLRVIEESLNRHQLNIFYKNKRLKASKSGISARLRAVDYRYYEEIFNSLTKIYSKELNAENKKQIRLFDSTVITLSSKLLECGFLVPTKEKKQIKLSIGYADIPTNVRFGDKDSDHSEDVALKSAIKESSTSKEDVVVFDRGVSSRKTFHEFKETGINFVTRLNEKANYRVIRSNMDGDLSDGIEEDSIVHLRSKNGWIKSEFRLIKLNKEGKIYNFLTNMHDISSAEVTEIYKSRWDIELFFKFIKQHLNAKHFLSRDINGIKVVAYMILIASILILTFKKLNKIESYKMAKKIFVEQLRRALTYDIILIYKDDPRDFKMGFAF